MPSWATGPYHTRLSPSSSDCRLVLVQVSDLSQPWPGVGRPTFASTWLCGQHVCVCGCLSVFAAILRSDDVCPGVVS